MFVFLTDIMIIRSVFFVALIFFCTFSTAARTCDRKPAKLHHPKSSYPPPYRIVFKGNIDYYVPNRTYTGNIKICIQ